MKHIILFCSLFYFIGSFYMLLRLFMILENESTPVTLKRFKLALTAVMVLASTIGVVVSYVVVFHAAMWIFAVVLLLLFLSLLNSGVWFLGDDSIKTISVRDIEPPPGTKKRPPMPSGYRALPLAPNESGSIGGTSGIGIGGRLKNRRKRRRNKRRKNNATKIMS